MSLVAANRDGHCVGTGANPDVYAPAREVPTSHLAFGHGIHRCIGAELAKLELRVTLPALARRFPQMRVATGSDGPVFRTMSLVHGLETLPVRLMQEGTVKVSVDG